MSFRRSRSALYGAARPLGDLSAIAGGPVRILWRIGRRVLGALLGRLFR